MKKAAIKEWSLPFVQYHENRSNTCTDRDLCDDNMYKKRRELFFCNLLQQADDFFVLTHKNEILFNLCA